MVRTWAILTTIGIILACTATTAFGQRRAGGLLLLRQLEIENLQLKDEIITLKDENAALQDDATAQAVEIRDLQQRNTALAARVKLLTDERQRREALVRSLQQQIANSQSRSTSSPVANSGTSRERTVVDAEQNSDADQAVHQQLQWQADELELDDIDLDTAIRYLAGQARLNFHVRWYALAAVGIRPSARITVHLSGVTLAEELGAILENVGGDEALSFAVDSGVITISTIDDLRNVRCVPICIDDVTDPQANSAVSEALSRTESPEFADVPLVLVIKYLRALTGLTINVRWHALSEVGVDKNTPVNMSLTDVPIDKVLRIVLEDIGEGDPLCYMVDGGVLTISTSEDLQED